MSQLPPAIITRIEIKDEHNKPIKFIALTRQEEKIKFKYSPDAADNKELVSSQYATILQCFHSGKPVTMTISETPDGDGYYTLESLILDSKDKTSHQ
ncbi:hypothetical protein [Xenorhabdus bovienii]|uniref:hypothetical protein n=1 Tax=Xenorhabdus bovienii TaxID=40576 RepID=UPI0023B307A1|nr:hypothetical protein [Xenorhabdus bovienii]MDE9444902.1 hypothetical protein [Xenorhabdus bovienii]MDE9537197.1 hypothetical protein [Xenorhabdus bovienii]MDE9588969.1 hypothetical protein [Xenorhabdus bovienii]